MSFSQGQALVIGVGSYQYHPEMDVPGTASDANAVAGVLQNPQLCGYPEQQVTTLYDASATRTQILATLDTLARRAAERDTVLIFYAGHGHYGEDGYYLTTHDTKINNRQVVKGSGIHQSELIEKVRLIKAKRLLLIMNACHAGEISPVLGGSEEPLRDVPMPPAVSATVLGTGEGRVIISACRENQVSFVGPGPLTFFTQALVDGLQGKGVNSSRGYINVFDLYMHLYFTLEETIARQVSAEMRKKYGQKQEPELTILKGVGPFAVSLWRGSQTLGDFESSDGPPADTAVREVNPAYAKNLMRQHQQTISDQAQVGTAIAGDVHGNVTSIQGNVSGPVLSGSFQGPVHIGDDQRKVLDFGSGNTFGNVQTGDVIAGDLHTSTTTHSSDDISVGNITNSSGIAIGRGARSTVRTVNSGGGDYAEGNIDKRQGSVVQGDQFNMTGNFSGALLNIKSTLNTVSQSIGALQGDIIRKQTLQELVAQLRTELEKVPASHASEAEQTAKRVELAVAELSKPQPDKEDVEYSLTRLQKAAENIAIIVPNVLPIAMQIADALRKMLAI